MTPEQERTLRAGISPQVQLQIRQTVITAGSLVLQRRGCSRQTIRLAALKLAKLGDLQVDPTRTNETQITFVEGESFKTVVSVSPKAAATA